MMLDVFNLKYRGYSEERNKWLYGYHVDDGLFSYIIDTNFREMIHTSPDSLLVKADMINKSSLGLFSFERDIDGIEIYSGDILLSTTEEDSPFEEEFYILVMYERDGFYGVSSQDYINSDTFRYCRLQGNIFENSNLLYLCTEGEDEFDEEI